MIKNSGVVYTYTPASKHSEPVSPSKPTIGEFKPTEKNKGSVIPPIRSSMPNTPVQRLPGPSKQPPFQTQKPKTRLPLPPLPPIKPNLGMQNQMGQPPRFRPPTPRYPVPGNKPIPWNDPFAFQPPSRMPSKYSQAKNLSDFASTAPLSEPQKEFHHGLPIEETPEIPLQLEDMSHDLDTTYVDRLFGVGESPKVPVTVEEVKPSEPENVPVHPEPEKNPIKTADPIEHNNPIDSFIPEGLQKTALPVLENKKNIFSFPSLFSRKKNDSNKTQTSFPEKHTDTVHIPEHEGHEKVTKSKLNILRPNISFKRGIGVVLLLAAAYGLLTPIIPRMALEATYAQILKGEEQKQALDEAKPLPASIPLSVNPMVAPDGKIIEPVNTDFSLVIPSVGINAAVIPGINPLDRKSYEPALKKGVAQSKTSYLPTQNGTMYLFSHSTNYEWFVSDLNAIFYNVKNLKENDYIIVFYQGKRYVYQYKSRQVVSPKETSSLIPEAGSKRLILQTCWPPGSVAQRLLLYADLVNEE